ncbi:MAG: hypothetical protein M3256_14775 [Actinomycetota bacterium]|nr:hypothetical protein [Actinomycetota bacterium]
MTLHPVPWHQEGCRHRIAQFLFTIRIRRNRPSRHLSGATLSGEHYVRNFVRQREPLTADGSIRPKLNRWTAGIPYDSTVLH